jgi:non-ribosomal peptide synthase protein (TIGR01720 family)
MRRGLTREAALADMNTKFQSGFDLSKGPLFHAILYRAETRDHLLLIAHHLIVDAISWHIIVEDLISAYLQAHAGQKIILPAKTAPYREWVESIRDYSESGGLESELPYWYAEIGKMICWDLAGKKASAQTADTSAEQNAESGAEPRAELSAKQRAEPGDEALDEAPDVAHDEPPDKLRTETPEEAHDEPCAESRTEPCEAPRSFARIRAAGGLVDQLLSGAGSAIDAEVNDLLLCALALAVREWNGQQKICVEVESNGRAGRRGGINIDRTVGWFSHSYPVTLETADDVGESIILVKNALQAVPGDGAGYGMLLSRGDFGAGPPRPRIAFNFFGDGDYRDTAALRDADISRSPLPAGKMIADANPLANEISVSGGIRDNALEFTVSYETAVLRKHEIERFCKLYEAALRGVVSYSSGGTAGDALNGDALNGVSSNGDSSNGDAPDGDAPAWVLKNEEAEALSELLEV